MSAPVRMSHRFTALESIKVPRVMRTVFYMLLIAFLSALVFLIYAPWVQTATGRGAVNTLNPNERKQDINALVPGRIEQWYVRDGSAVKQGDPIVRIADIDPQLIDRLQAERISAFREYIADVASSAYPEDKHVVKMNPGELAAFRAALKP